MSEPPSPKRHMWGKLRAQNRPQSGDIPLFDAKTSIGRRQAVRIQHPKISQHQCDIEIGKDRRVTIVAKSLHGFRINGYLTTMVDDPIHELKPGDHVEFCQDIQFIFEMPDGPSKKRKHSAISAQQPSLDTVVGKWRFGKLLGQGTYSRIYAATDIFNSAPRAIKIEKPDKGGKIGTKLLIEGKVLQELKGEYTCHHYASFKYVDTAYMVMEHAGSRNASEYRKTQPMGYFTIRLGAHVGLLMLKALRFMHEKGYIHRDIKPSNFVVSDEGTNLRCKIVDFGLARQHVLEGKVQEERNTSEFHGSSLYASLATHHRKDMGRKDDVWSLFFVIVDSIMGELPWKKCRTDRPQVLSLKELEFGDFANNEHKVPATLPAELQDFARHLHTLKFQDVPDYNLLESLLEQLGNKHRYPECHLQPDGSILEHSGVVPVARSLSTNATADADDVDADVEAAFASKEYSPSNSPSPQYAHRTPLLLPSTTPVLHTTPITLAQSAPASVFSSASAIPHMSLSHSTPHSQSQSPHNPYLEEPVILVPYGDSPAAATPTPGTPVSDYSFSDSQSGWLDRSKSYNPTSSPLPSSPQAPSAGTMHASGSTISTAGFVAAESPVDHAALFSGTRPGVTTMAAAVTAASAGEAGVGVLNGGVHSAPSPYPVPPQNLVLPQFPQFPVQFPGFPPPPGHFFPPFAPFPATPFPAAPFGSVAPPPIPQPPPYPDPIRKKR